jgi:hypothetical protein
MMTTAVILCFAAFLRCDELLSLQWEQIRFVGQTHMELFIEHQKTDQYRAGTWKIVARVGGPCCPVALVERLLDEGRYVFLDPGALIRSSVISSSRQYIKRDQPCYDTVLGWFKDAALALGLDPKRYGTHSGRRGGATGAAAFEVPDHLFKEHGGWRSERAKDGYVVSRLQARLSVTQNLGLQPGISISELEAFEHEARLSPSYSGLSFGVTSPFLFLFLSILTSVFSNPAAPLHVPRPPLLFPTCLYFLYSPA